MSNIVMLLSNAFRPDPRVAREAEGLAQAGHHVTVICWDRQVEFPASEVRDGYCIERIQNIRTVYGAGPRQILSTPRFWIEAVKRAQNSDPDVVHCHDLDTLPAGWWIKRRRSLRLVYDAHEDYPALMSLYLPGPMVRGLSWLERYLLRGVDHTITASTVFADKLRSQGVSSVLTIGNYHPLEPFDAIGQEDVAAARSELGLGQNELVVAYIGGFSRNRELLPLIDAAQELPLVQVLLWGDGHQRAEVEMAASTNPNVRYLGWLPADQVPLYMRCADMIYYCLNADYPGAVYNAPNTLSQAMAATRPIIANDVGDLGRIVRQTGCGMLVPAVTPEEIRRAVNTLRDPELRREMGNAGRTAAETRYSWRTALRTLKTMYRQLLEET